MITNLTLISTVIIPTIIILSFTYARILTQQNKHELVFYILATTLVFTLFLWVYQIMGDPFRTRGNLAYFIDKLGLDKSTHQMEYNIYGERNDGKTCSIEGQWGGSLATKPKYESGKKTWVNKECKTNPDEDVDSDKYATDAELETFTDVFYTKFIFYTLFFGYIMYANRDSAGSAIYTLFMTNSLLFGLWLLLLIFPYPTKDFALWPDTIEPWPKITTIVTFFILIYLILKDSNNYAKVAYSIVWVAVVYIVFNMDPISTSYGPEKVHQTSSLGYYINKLGLNKQTDKLKYDIYIQDEDLNTDCKIIGTWSKNTEIPKITGDMEGCSLDTLGVEVGI